MLGTLELSSSILIMKSAPRHCSSKASWSRLNSRAGSSFVYRFITQTAAYCSTATYWNETLPREFRFYDRICDKSMLVIDRRLPAFSVFDAWLLKGAFSRSPVEWHEWHPPAFWRLYHERLRDFPGGRVSLKIFLFYYLVDSSQVELGFLSHVCWAFLRLILHALKNGVGSRPRPTQWRICSCRTPI